MEFAGKTAIITGASGGLGGEIALALAAEGMDCVCHYHTHEANVLQAVAAIQKSGRRAVAVQADLSETGAAEKIFQTATQLGSVRVLVNSASLFLRQPLGTFGPPEAATMLNVNLAAPLNLCNAFGAYLKQQGGLEHQTIAAIINLIDVAAVKPWAEYGPYCASRAGMVGLTRSLAKELAPAVTVNAVAPGIVTWPGKMDPNDEQRQLKMIPAGRFGTPKDITRTIEFLLNNDYITGQVVCVDGGRSL